MIFLTADQEGPQKFIEGVTTLQTFLPVVLIFVVVADMVVESAVRAILTAAKTGSIGDATVFVSTTDEAFPIRTLETEPAHWLMTGGQQIRATVFATRKCEPTHEWED